MLHACIGVSAYRYIAVSLYGCVGVLVYRCNGLSVKSKKLCYEQVKKNKKIYRTISPKWYQILEKSASETLLESFGHPPGAKIPQERHQDQNLMKNV